MDIYIVEYNYGDSWFIQLDILRQFGFFKSYEEAALSLKVFRIDYEVRIAKYSRTEVFNVA